MGATETEGIMGFVEVKVNGHWINLMAAEVRCQMCNDSVIIAELAKAENVDAATNATWQCKKCSAVNG